MQLTLEQCKQQIAQLQQLVGYRQAITEMEEDKKPEEKEDAKAKKDS